MRLIMNAEQLQTIETSDTAVYAEDYGVFQIQISGLTGWYKRTGQLKKTEYTDSLFLTFWLFVVLTDDM